MNFANILKNDIADSDKGMCVSLWFQGCDLCPKCPGCQNSSLWDPNEGKQVDNDLIVETILEALDKNDVHRNLSILGGEPLAEFNKKDCNYILSAIRKARPSLYIILWTGYYYEDLKNRNDQDIQNILNLIDVLVDGPYAQGLRDITLKLRGSLNQRVLRLKNGMIESIDKS